MFRLMSLGLVILLTGVLLSTCGQVDDESVGTPAFP